MTDLATLGLRVESHEVATADQRLDALTASSGRAEAGADSLAAAARGLGNSLLPTLQSIDASVREMLALTRAQHEVIGTTVQQAAVTADLAAELNQASTAGMRFYASFKGAQTSWDGASRGARDYAESIGAGTRKIGENDAHMIAYRDHLRNSADEMRHAAREGLGLSRQLADIAVTGIAGMSPLMIAIQQGPQILDLFQEKAIRTGTTIRGAMMATGTAIWTALAPLLPIIAAVGAAAAVMGGGIALATRAASKEIGDLTEGMGLTEEQLKRLEESGVSTTTTMGDVFRGAGTTIKESFFDLFGDQIDWLGAKWNGFLDAAWRIAVGATKNIAGAFTGAVYVVRDTWKLVPDALGDAAYSAANAVISGVEWMINKGVQLLNGLVRSANDAAQAIGLAALIPELSEVDFDTIANPYAGAARRMGLQAGASWAEGFEQGSAFVDRQAERLIGNIRASGQARVRAGAGEADATRGGRAGSPERLARETLEALPTRELEPLRLLTMEIITPLEMLADELRLVDQLAQDTARGMASAFGETGRAIGDLLTVMSGYESRLADIALAEQEHQLTASQATRERAMAQTGAYGDMAAAARGFFKEGSDGYRVLMFIEQMYRMQQLAGMIQEMAMGERSTAVSIAQSASKGLASMAAGAAKMFEHLGPYAFPAVAAMLGLLASLGLKGGSGGGRSGPAAANDNVQATTDAVRASTAQEQQSRAAAASMIAGQVEVRVSADRDGLKAYVVGTSQRAAAPMVAQGSSAAVGVSREIVPAEAGRRARMTMGRR